MVKRVAKNNGKDAVGEIARYDVKDAKGQVVVSAGSVITADLAKKLSTILDLGDIAVKARLTKEIKHMDAYQEEKLTIGQANIETDNKGYFIEERTSVRVHGTPS